MSTTPRLRWKLGLAILTGCIAVHAGFWFALSADRTTQIMVAWGTVSFTAFMSVVWWTFLSGVTWRTRIKGLAAFAVCAGLFGMAVKVAGYQGDMMPRLRFRWSRSSEEVAENYWKSADVSNEQDTTDQPASESLGADLIAELRITKDDWPGFRGAKRDGIVRGVEIRRDWDAKPPKELWRHPVGLGWSSFSVVGEFVFTQEQRRDREALVCYDLESGEQVWTHYVKGRFSEEMGGAGPRATPTVYDSRVYALSATGILSCVVARTGRKLWSTDVLKDADATNPDWAMAGSPLVYDDFVVVSPGSHVDADDGTAVIAYHRKTGEKIWTTGNRAAGYSAPRIETIAGVRQVLLFDAEGLASYDPVDGHQIWEFPWTNSPKIIATQPIAIGEGRIFFGCGYGKGSVVIDVTDANDGADVMIVAPWPSTRLKLKFNDAVVKDGYVYGLDEGILTCLDLETAKPQWKRGRYGYGQLVLVDDVLLIQAEKGDVVLVEANPKQHNEIARFTALTDKTWNHPVVVRGKLLVRNAEEVSCFDVAASE